MVVFLLLASVRITLVRYVCGERTVLEAYRCHVSNPHAAKPSDTWSRWASQFAWRERAADYEAHIASKRREAYERGMEEEAERQGALAERMRAETFEMLHRSYERAMEWFERDDFDPSEMNMSHVVQIIRLHMEAVKTFGTTEKSDDDDWTEEDEAWVLEKFEEIRAEADADELDEEESPEETEDS